MRGFILRKGEPYYSLFGRAYKEIKMLSHNYNWLISNAECYPKELEYRKKLSSPYAWMTGEELAQMLCKEDFQWVWGVLSGFPNTIALDEVLKSPLPYADGNGAFWENPLTIQHPLAEVEIVAWDSCCSLFISKNNDLIREITTVYPQIEDLESYND